MLVDNAAVSAMLAEIADLLDLQGGNPHRIQAYRTAAQAVRGMPADFAAKVGRGEGPRARGLGPGMLHKITEFARTGSCSRLRELRRAVPIARRRLLTVRGLGPQRIRRLADSLSLRTLRDLQVACREHAIRQVEGFGARTEASIRQAISSGGTAAARHARTAVARRVAALVRYMRHLDGTTVTIAGSLRRRRATIGDVDVLVTAASPAQVVDRFVRYPGFARVVARGSVRATAYLGEDLQVDLRVVPAAVSGAALLYFTGSKAHNIELRRIARSKKLKLNEYGLFRGGRLVAGRTEHSVYQALGLRWVAPLDREGVESIKPASR